jgi:hypothetical protein
MFRQKYDAGKCDIMDKSIRLPKFGGTSTTVTNVQKENIGIYIPDEWPEEWDWIYP